MPGLTVYTPTGSAVGSAAASAVGSVTLKWVAKRRTSAGVKIRFPAILNLGSGTSWFDRQYSIRCGRTPSRRETVCKLICVMGFLRWFGRGEHGQRRGVGMMAAEAQYPVRIEMGKTERAARGRQMVKASKEVKSRPVIITRLLVMYNLSQCGATPVVSFFCDAATPIVSVNKGLGRLRRPSHNRRKSYNAPSRMRLCKGHFDVEFF